MLGSRHCRNDGLASDREGVGIALKRPTWQYEGISAMDTVAKEDQIVRRRWGLILSLGLCVALASTLPPVVAAPPTLAERVEAESAAMRELFAPVARKHGLSVDVAMHLATQLGSRDWAQAATKAGVPKKVQKVLWQDLNALPHPNFDQLTPYNLLAPAKDRWGLSPKQAIDGWNKYGRLIEEVAIAHGLDPVILGAYVWTESNFDTNQYYAARGLHAVGLGSVQAQDHPELGKTIAERVRRLQQDPRLNLEITAREFKAKWNPQDMFGTVMDVWYPAWRRGGTIPNLGNAFGYMQLFSNRYFLLLELVGD